VTDKSLEQRVEGLSARIEQLQDRVGELAAGMVTMVTEVAPEAENRRVEELAAQVAKLQKKVETMTAGMVTMVTDVIPEAERAAAAEKAVSPAKKPDDIVAWAGSSALLPRISTLCFVLVVALALRTVTDSGVIEKHVGSLLGMVYAAAIMLVGWFRYRKGSSIAPVFSISGALLMFSIIIETHTRFGSLPTAPAYLLLLGTGVGMAFTGRTAKSLAPTVAGTLGMALAGVALNFPVPSLPLLAVLLLAANAMALAAALDLKRDWLRWVLFALTGVVMQVWSFRVKAVLLDPDFPSPYLFPYWFIPAVAVLALFFFGSAFLGMYRIHRERKLAFDYVAPAASAFVFFTAAQHVAIPLWESGVGLGVTGLVAASALLGIASFMVRGKRLSALEFNSFTVAAVVLLVLALSAATGALLAAVPLLSASAFHLAIISDRWQSGGTRVISYLMQVFVALALAAVLAGGQAGVPLLLGIAASGTVAVVGLLHYRWCRRKSPPADSVVFSRIDKRDLGGVSLLFASLTGWFFLYRVGVYNFLLSTGGGKEIGNAFSGAQSLLINAAAIGFFVLAYVSRNRELRNVALLITLVGAAKVFLYDLVGVEGIPRVLSVFSFGFVAAAASYVLGRWQKAPPPGKSEDAGEAAASAVGGD
jgi:hypothetical protein